MSTRALATTFFGLGLAGLLGSGPIAAAGISGASPESAGAVRLAPVDFEIPGVGEILLAQADAVDARRRRRPNFQRPGGGRGEDAGAPSEEPAPEPTDSVAPSEASPETGSAADESVAPSAEGESSGAGETPPERRPSAVRPGSSDESSGEPAPRREARPTPRPRRYENELPDYEIVPLPDRWRIVENLGVNERWYDPYNQNTLKADRPIPGTKDWFFNLGLIYDGVVELRKIPTPTGVAGDKRPETDLFGDGSQVATSHTFLASLSVVQGDTTFRPPDWEFRLTPALNLNYAEVEQLSVLRVDPREGSARFDYAFALQEAFVDKHLWNKSDRFDFDSLRIGIQPFNADFRGFLFDSQEPGVRLFGNFANNRLQYNLAWFRRLGKDTNSGLNDIQSWRDDDVVIANLYYQDFPVLGFNIEALFAANINREGGDRDFDDNSNLIIPAPVGLIGGHDYEVYYIGFAGDGHIERLNLSFQLYGALGHDDYNSIAQDSQDIQSFFAAVEASYDIDWIRLKAFGLYSMGDDDPYDDKAQGFDTILDNPNFAGATTSFWQRQQIPLVFGGGVILSGQNSIVPSLRSSKIEGQSNFVNPGLWLVGGGADFDVLPQLRLVTNVSWLSWDSVEVLETLRQQGRLSREIGWDVSAGLIYRPFFSNNIILRASGAVLIPGSGYEELFDERDNDPPYSVLLNMTLTY